MVFWALRAFAQSAPDASAPSAGSLREIVAITESLPQLRGLIVARDGEVLVRQGFRGYAPDEKTNIKSLSKTVLSALVGIAIARGVLMSTSQPIASLLADALPAAADPRLKRVTLGHLLSMRAGLESTSDDRYGAWIAAPDQVRFALGRPFVAEPGGDYLYSTGNTHLLSAILTRASGRSTLELMRAWLGEPLGIGIAPWERDAQGIYLGGNNMMLSALGLLAFAEMYRNGGRAGGQQIVPEAWVATSWTPRGPARYFGHDYGYGWFIARMADQEVRYGWGYGGQMLYVVPALGLSVVMVSGAQEGALQSGYIARLHALLVQIIELAATGAAPR